MPPAALAPRKPRFTLDDDDDDPSESEPEPDLPRTAPSVPAIVVEDAGQGESRTPHSPVRDLDREEKHVGFAAEPDFVALGGRGESETGAEEAAAGEKGRTETSAEGYPPFSRRASSDVSAHRHGESSDDTATAPPSAKTEGEGKGFDRPEFAQPEETTPPALKRRLPPLPGFLAWIKPHLNWKGMRPVVRASVASWCGLLLSAFSPSVLSQIILPG